MTGVVVGRGLQKRNIRFGFGMVIKADRVLRGYQPAAIGQDIKNAAQTFNRAAMSSSTRESGGNTPDSAIR